MNSRKIIRNKRFTKELGGKGGGKKKMEGGEEINEGRGVRKETGF
jgi:hypothetical protein